MPLSDALACAVQILWALCVYVEAVSVLPQLRMMQKAKVVEKFTAHYVFALGLSRFISCAHWILQLVDGDSFLLQVHLPARDHTPCVWTLLARPHWPQAFCICYSTHCFAADYHYQIRTDMLCQAVCSGVAGVCCLPCCFCSSMPWLLTVILS